MAKAARLSELGSRSRISSLTGRRARKQFRPELIDKFQQGVRFVLRERCGGLVHNQNACLVGQRFCDLDHLFVGNGERADEARGIELVSDAAEELRRFVTVEPRPGLLLLWESWLRHEVLPGGGRGERLSISFNFA